VADCGKPGVDSRDEGKHTGRNDLLFVIMLFRSVNVNAAGRASVTNDEVRRSEGSTELFL